MQAESLGDRRHAYVGIHDSMTKVEEDVGTSFQQTYVQDNMVVSRTEWFLPKTLELNLLLSMILMCMTLPESSLVLSLKVIIKSTMVTPLIPSDFNVIQDVQISQDTPVNAVQTSFEIPQTDVDMVEFSENSQPDVVAGQPMKGRKH
ncbi:hypothetical protein QL285_075320 [Trifolium repens]|jgi:hypothetical protein|nr:hypothetical protein QL285_075320 [Trifolium repens]